MITLNINSPSSQPFRNDENCDNYTDVGRAFSRSVSFSEGFSYLTIDSKNVSNVEIPHYGNIFK